MPLKGPGGPDPSGPPGESGKWGRSSLTDRGEFPRPKPLVNKPALSVARPRIRAEMLNLAVTLRPLAKGLASEKRAITVAVGNQRQLVRIRSRKAVSGRTQRPSERRRSDPIPGASPGR